MTAATPAADAGHALILVVERDPHVRALERYFLEQAGRPCAVGYFAPGV